jgi:MFS family permease
MAALSHRGFAAFFTAASISNAASWMQLVAVPALLYDLTGQATWLGLSSMATLVPAVLLTPWAGVLADRLPRRGILLVTQTVMMIAAFGLWMMYLADVLTPWRIVGMGLVTGTATGFQTSAWQSFIPSLVPPEDMLDAVRLNSVQFTVARFVGPALAGAVLAAFGTGAAIFLNAATFPLVIVVLAVVPVRVGSQPDRHERVVRALVEGIRYVWGHAPVRLAVVLAFVSSAGGQSLQYVASAIAAQVYDRPSTANAGLLTALGLGALVASVAATVIGGRVARSRQVSVALVLYTASAALLALSTRYEVGLIAYFVGGLAHLTMAVALNTLVQAEVPDAMRGRAVSSYLLGILAGIPLGSLVIGRLGDAIGLRPVLLADALLFAVMLSGLTLTQRLKILDRGLTRAPAPSSA